MKETVKMSWTDNEEKWLGEFNTNKKTGKAGKTLLYVFMWVGERVKTWSDC